jgi:hypothetical protein
VWLLVLEPTELSFDDDTPAGVLRVGERVQVVEVGTAAILIALPEGGTAWVVLDPRVQLIAQ